MSYPILRFQLTRPVWGEPGSKGRKSTASGFQLTRPVWGEPGVGISNITFKEFQLTRPVWGEPFDYNIKGFVPIHFNSLAPCGANLEDVGAIGKDSKFQLTRPVWGEPKKMEKAKPRFEISTHSPRVGRTTSVRRDRHEPDDFNSLAPCGANPVAPGTATLLFRFQLTRPVWGEPLVCDLKESDHEISTHSPRVGRTATMQPHFRSFPDFNSLAPCGANPLRYYMYVVC